MRTFTKNILAIAAMLGMIMSGATTASAQESENWTPLFDGQTLNSWQASENPESFSVKDGKIVVDGPRAHLFYIGPINDSVIPPTSDERYDFNNFELKADVKTTGGANSGIYFHTAFQEEGWPSKGYEVQVNNTHDDPRKTGSLYGVDDVMHNSPAQDGTWFTIYVKVKGNRVTIKVDGKKVVQYTEPAEVDRDGRILDSGTFALQAHDPESVVYYKNIKVRPLD